MNRNWIVGLLAATALAIGGCAGEDGKDGAPGAPGTPGAGTEGPQGPAGQDGEDVTATAKAESCGVCHAGAGAEHQAIYTRYTNASALAVTIDGISSVANAGATTFTSTMTFTVTKGGVAVSGLTYNATSKLFESPALTFEQARLYAVEYTAGTRKFDKMVQYDNATLAATATAGQYTVQNATAKIAPEATNAVAYVYLADGPITFEAFTVYEDVGHVGREFGAVAYESAANNDGCIKCHGSPYMKHGYRAAKVPGLDDFAACKTCHYDTRTGGHQAWQQLVDDPAAAAAGTAPDAVKYAYKASVMNDTHMSHAMEFAYPQSMANCVTCHEGKLDTLVLTDANFTLATCKSCHPVTGVGGTDPKRAPSLTALLQPVAAIHTMDLYTYTGDCNFCHKANSFAKSFKQIHSGYDKLTYTANGTKYSTAFTTAISDASVANNVLSFTVTVTENVDLAGLAPADVKPTAYLAPYGYDTKDFLLAAKNTKLATPGAGWTVTPGTATATTMSWAVTANLATVGGSAWTDKIASGAIKRLEIGVLPFLANLDGITYLPHGSTTPATAPVALNMVTKTFDLAGNAFAAAGTAIVDTTKCNKCHDALGTTFHTADRGGSVVGCRLCHTTLSGGSHLEMQSRSIDSYVHAIHAMQPFDVGDVDFSDPVAAMKYNHHVESTYPNFTLLNCESCHNPGTYEVPDQTKSLPGILSAADAVEGLAGRNIGLVPSVVVGPASRACGSCHRAHMINENLGGELAAFEEHTASFGTRLENGTGVLDAAIAKIMSLFN
jgi:hypothetical protein